MFFFLNFLIAPICFSPSYPGFWVSRIYMKYLYILSWLVCLFPHLSLVWLDEQMTLSSRLPSRITSVSPRITWWVCINLNHVLFCTQLLFPNFLFYHLFSFLCSLYGVYSLYEDFTYSLKFDSGLNTLKLFFFPSKIETLKLTERSKILFKNNTLSLIHIRKGKRERGKFRAEKVLLWFYKRTKILIIYIYECNIFICYGLYFLKKSII